MCIYIVDDEELACRGLAYMVNCIFKGSPQEIHCFTSPSEALQKMEEYPPDIILLDMLMDEMNGLEFINSIDKKFTPKIVIISGNDDYNFIRESFKLRVEDYLLKPVEYSELETVMLRLQTMHAGPLENILLNKNQDAWSFVAIVKTPYETELGKNIISIPRLCDAEAMASAITYREAFGESVYIFFFNNEKHYDECKDLFLDIFQSFTVDKSDIFKASYSRCVRQNSINSAIDEAKTLLKCRIYDEESGCYGAENTPEFDFSDDTDYRADIERITSFINGEDKEYFKRFIDVWFSYDGLSELDYDIVKERYALFVDRLYGVINIDNDSAQIKDFDEFYTLKEMINYVRNLSSDMFKALNNNRFEVNLINEALEYINNNYGKDINLSFMSNKFNLSYSYFSRIFKMYAGVSFTQYLLKVRMEKARDLLIGNPNLKIKEVALMVGYDYDNVQNFTRAFKKYFGRSPQFYKK